MGRGATSSPRTRQERRHDRAARTLDLVIVALAAPVLLVVGSLVALAVWLDSPGPVLYRTTRVGRLGRDFTMFKLRTMVHGAVGPAVSAHGDERYTPLGTLIAATRLDEIPQLWHVVRGDMRLVGPRPEDRTFVDLFPEAYAEILRVPPGLTGACQLDFAFEGRLLAAADPHDRARVYAETILPTKVGIDLDYVRTRTLREDLRILLLTPAVPLTRYGVDARRLGGHVVRRPAVAGLIVLAAAWLAVFVAALAAAGIAAD